MHHASSVRSIVVMGVSGSGKSTIGTLLAQRLDYRFHDGDKLHSPKNIAIMSAGKALTDEDRLPWLKSVGELLKDADTQGQGAVVACSALKLAYRDILRSYVPSIFFVFLDGAPDVVQERILLRSHEFMPPSLLVSQFANLEPLKENEQGLKVDITLSPEEIVNEISNKIGTLQANIESK